MSKVKLSKLELNIVISVIEREINNLDHKLKHFIFLDKYDKDKFPDRLENVLSEQKDMFTTILQKLTNKLKD